MWGHIRVHNLNGPSDELTKSLGIKTKSCCPIGQYTMYITHFKTLFCKEQL